MNAHSQANRLRSFSLAVLSRATSPDNNNRRCIPMCNTNEPTLCQLRYATNASPIPSARPTPLCFLATRFRHSPQPNPPPDYRQAKAAGPDDVGRRRWHRRRGWDARGGTRRGRAGEQQQGLACSRGRRWRRSNATRLLRGVGSDPRSIVEGNQGLPRCCGAGVVCSRL